MPSENRQPQNRERTWYDIHMHAMTLGEASFTPFIQHMQLHPGKNLVNELLSFDFLAGEVFSNPMKKFRNLISVMDNDISSIFEIMEKDLKGEFCERDEPSWIKDGRFHLGEQTYSRFILTPLVMDFNIKEMNCDDLYYDSPPSKPIWRNIEDIADGIKNYHKRNPHGIFEIYPFLGINTENYPLKEIEEIMEKYFGGYSGSHILMSGTSEFMRRLDRPFSSIGSNIFAGIKLYPPMGFNPWPEHNRELMERVRYLYHFCQEKKIPVTTHCDDQGFRIIDKEKAWQFTSPRTWEKVLSEFPGLKLNYAHFGNQYHRKGLFRRPNDWFHAIVDQMCRYPSVYADISFNGTTKDYYPFLAEQLSDLDASIARHVKRRILFGSDFMVNLIKIESYRKYMGIFRDSPFSDEERELFGSANPERFLFENTLVDQIFHLASETRRQGHSILKKIGGMMRGNR
jgi:hypothetical protein